MAMQTGKSSIFAKYGNRAQKAFKAHSNDQAEVKHFGELPGGMFGTARLVEIKIEKVKADEQKKDKKHVGELFFYAAGAVVWPHEFTDENKNKRKVLGLRTNVTEMLCDTPEKTWDNARKTFEQHMQWVIHLCRLSLGAKFSGDDPTELEDFIENVNGAIKSKENRLDIFFDFETQASKPATDGPNKGKVFINHYWKEYNPDFKPTNMAVAGMADGGEQKSGPAEDEEEDEEATSTTTIAEPEEEENEEEEVKVKPSTKPQANGKAEGKKPAFKKGDATAKPTSKPNKDDFRDDDDLDSLAERADNNDVEAKKKLTVFAKEAGIDKETVKNAETWVEIVELMKNKTASTEDEEEDEEPEEEKEEEGEDEVEVPEVDNMVGYKPLNKEGKEFKNSVECIVTKVTSKDKTVDLQNMGTKKVYKNVPWSKISPWEG